MGLFGMLKKAAATPKPKPEPTQHTTTMEVAGFFALREEGFMRVLSSDPRFELSTAELVEKGFGGKRVYKFKTRYNKGIGLLPEPDNPYDKNAIAITLNDEIIGHVPADTTGIVKAWMDKDCIVGLKLVVKGGPVRKIFETGESMAYFNDYEATLTIDYME